MSILDVVSLLDRVVGTQNKRNPQRNEKGPRSKSKRHRYGFTMETISGGVRLHDHMGARHG